MPASLGRCWRSPAASKTRCSPAAAALLRRAEGGRCVGPVWGEGVAEVEGARGMVVHAGAHVVHGRRGRCYLGGRGGREDEASGGGGPVCNMPPGRQVWLDAANKGPGKQGTKIRREFIVGGQHARCRISIWRARDLERSGIWLTEAVTPHGVRGLMDRKHHSEPSKNRACGHNRPCLSRC